jgi:hypothetical protein
VASQVFEIGEGVAIWYGVLVEDPIVLYWAKISVLLFDKEGLRGVGGVGWLDVFLFQSFLQDFIYHILFLKSHGISFASESFGGIRSEGNNMVPFAMGRESLGCFLAEYFGVMVVTCSYESAA